MYECMYCTAGMYVFHLRVYVLYIGIGCMYSLNGMYVYVLYLSAGMHSCIVCFNAYMYVFMHVIGNFYRASVYYNSCYNHVVYSSCVLIACIGNK